MASEGRHTTTHDDGGSAAAASSSTLAAASAGASTSAVPAASSSSAASKAKEAEGGETLADDSVCEICFNGDIEDDNLIVFCDGTGADGNPCTAVVHQYCYGVFQIPEGDDPWYCDMCAVKQGVRKVSPKLMKTMDKCVLCPVTTGAFKPLHNGTGWCHATCAVWIPETGFYDPKTMKDIIGVDAIERSRFRLICEFCHVREGACVQCLAHACRFSFHPICGFQHREQLKMDMEAVQVGQTFDVLKLVYCDRHKYLGDDAMEKKILIKKWKMNGKVDDVAAPEDEEDEEEIIARRRRGGKGSRGPYKKRKKHRKIGGVSDDEEEEPRQQEEEVSVQSSISDDSDAQMRDLSSEDSGDEEGTYELDEDGRKVRKTRAYMCADCGATKRKHNCPFAKERQEEKRKNKMAAKKERSSKRRKGEAGAILPGASDAQSEQIPNPFPNYHFVNTPSLARRRWRTETDSEVSSDDIHNDADLDMLADLLAKSEKAAEERQKAEAERLALYQPKLKSSPFSRRTSDGEPVHHGRVGRPRKHPQSPTPVANASRPTSKTNAEMAAVAAATNLVTEAHYHSVDPAILTPPMIAMLYNQVRALVDPTGLTANATLNAATEPETKTETKREETAASTTEAKPDEKKEGPTSADGATVKPEESAASSSASTPAASSSSSSPVLLPTAEAVSRVPVADNPVANFSFQFLVQPTTMQIFGAFAKTASELNAKSHPESIPASMPPSVPASLYFLNSLVSFHGALHAFVMQQRMAEIARIQSYNAQIEAARQAQIVRQKEKQEARMREREERVRERELEKQHKLQLKERDRLAKDAAKKSASAAMKGLQTSATFDALTAPSAAGKRGANAMPKAAGNMMGTSLQTAEGFVQLPPTEEMDLKSRLIRFVAFNAAKDKLLHLQKELLDPSVDEMRQFGLRLLLEYRGVEILRKWLETAVIAVEGLTKLEKMKGGSVAPTPSTPMLPQSATGDSNTSAPANADGPAESASANSASSAGAAPGLTPLLLNTDLALACMRAMHRLSDLADFSRQPTFPQTVVLLTKLSSHENPSIKEAATALKAKLPTPVTISAVPVVAPSQGPRALVTTKQQQQNTAYAMGQGASPSAYALGLVGANPINANRMQMQPNMAMYGQPGMMPGMQGSMIMNPNIRPTPHQGMIPGAVAANTARMQQPVAGPVPHQFNRGPIPNAIPIQQPQQRGGAPPYNRPPPQQGGRDMYGGGPPHMGQQPPQGGYFGAQPQGRQFGNQPMYDEQPYGDQNNYYGGPQQPQQRQYLPQPQQQPQRPPPSQYQQPPPQQGGGRFFNQQQQPPRGYGNVSPPSDDYFNDVVNNPQAGNTPSPTAASGSGAAMPNALSALTAMLNTSGPNNNGVENSNLPQAAASGAGNVDVAQLSQWLNTKLDSNNNGAAPAASPASANNPTAQLTALLAKVQQTGAGGPSAPANSQSASSMPLDQQLADLQVHVRHWDDQYNVLWHRHNAALLAIQSIQNSSNVMEKLQRMGELQQQEQLAHDLAAQLRNVQANQASIAARVQAVEQAMMLQQPQRPSPQVYQSGPGAYPPQQQQPPQAQYSLPTPPMPPQPHAPQAQSQQAQVAAVPGGDPRKILVTGLAAGTSESSLRQLFAHFGTLVSAALVIDPKTGQSSCTAYLTYVSADQAANILKIGMRNPYKLDGRDLKLVPAPPSS